MSISKPVNRSEAILVVLPWPKLGTWRAFSLQEEDKKSHGRLHEECQLSLNRP